MPQQRQSEERPERLPLWQTDGNHIRVRDHQFPDTIRLNHMTLDVLRVTLLGDKIRATIDEHGGNIGTVANDCKAWIADNTIGDTPLSWTGDQRRLVTQLIK